MIIIDKPNAFNSYNPDTNSALATFFCYLQKEIGCTYTTYMREDLLRDNKVYFSSNPDWQKLLLDEKLINLCPIYDVAFKALEMYNFYPIVWDYVPHRKGVQRDIMDLRNEFNIAHGLGVAINHGGQVRESIVFAGAVQDIDFHTKVFNPVFIQKCLAFVRMTLFTNNFKNIDVNLDHVTRVLKL